MRQTSAPTIPLVLALLQSLMEMKPKEIARQADGQASDPSREHITKRNPNEHNQTINTALHPILHHLEPRGQASLGGSRSSPGPPPDLLWQAGLVPGQHIERCHPRHPSK